MPRPKALVGYDPRAGPLVDLRSFCLSEAYSDVKLVAADGTVFNCHCLVLASASQMLKALLLPVRDSEPELCLSLPDFSVEQVTSFIKFVYGVEQEDTVQEAVELLRLFECAFNNTPYSLLMKPRHRGSEPRKTRRPVARPKSPADDDDDADADYPTRPAYQHPLDKDQCSACPFRSSSRYNLRYHYRSKHERVTCPLCQKCLSTKTYLQQHMARVHKKPELLRFACHLCPERFHRPSFLRDHVDETHVRKLQYVCDVCGQASVSKGQMIQHRVQKHTKRTRFPCRLCDKVYTENSHLKKHVRRHHGEVGGDGDDVQQQCVVPPENNAETAGDLIDVSPMLEVAEPRLF